MLVRGSQEISIALGRTETVVRVFMPIGQLSVMTFNADEGAPIPTLFSALSL